MTLRERLAHALFGPELDQIIQRAINAAISVRVDDSPGWEPLAGTGPHDRPWHELRSDLDDALEAWRKNFMVRRIVTLVRSYAVGNGITVSSDHPYVGYFVRDFWNHPKNRMDQRLGPMCDELVRAGELFVALFTNPVDGMSYVRLVPASTIREVQTDPDDYEREMQYGQIQEGTSELKWWLSPEHPRANVRAGSPRPESPRPGLPPVMLHHTINKPVGATRGESDLSTVLKWALRYSNWLEDRVRLNRVRTRAALLDVEIDDESQVEMKKRQLRRDDPLRAGIYVHGSGESLSMHNLQIQADQAEPDGKALRLAIVAGAGLGLHYFGEGESINYATAKEMGEPAARFYGERQAHMVRLVLDLTELAYHRHLLVTGKAGPSGGDLRLEASVTEVARADNEALAAAARDVVDALAQMRALGWIDDPTAIRLAFKFAGEMIDEEEIARILEEAKPAQQEDNTETNENDEE